jgi:hypothetical protein
MMVRGTGKERLHPSWWIMTTFAIQMTLLSFADEVNLFPSWVLVSVSEIGTYS